MKKILSLIMIGLVIMTGVICNTKKENEIKDVALINDYSFEVKYTDGKKEVFEYDNELECAEEYTDIWYIKEGKQELATPEEMVDVNVIDDYSFVVKYTDGKKEVFEYDNELECAEEYTDIWYMINEK